jgi:hypothetical protein
MPAPFRRPEVGGIGTRDANVKDKVAVVPDFRVLFEANPNALGGREEPVEGQAERVEQAGHLVPGRELKDFRGPVSGGCRDYRRRHEDRLLSGVGPYYRGRRHKESTGLVPLAT